MWQDKQEEHKSRKEPIFFDYPPRSRIDKQNFQACLFLTKVRKKQTIQSLPRYFTIGAGLLMKLPRLSYNAVRSRPKQCLVKYTGYLDKHTGMYIVYQVSNLN